MRQYGQCGLLATNTIAQGDTREVGLYQLTTVGWSIPRAVPSRKWPGAASLEVAHVWLRRDKWGGSFILDDQSVTGISPYLTESNSVSVKPDHLVANMFHSFTGSKLDAIGFVLEPGEARALIEKDPRNREILFP